MSFRKSRLGLAKAFLGTYVRRARGVVVGVAKKDAKMAHHDDRQETQNGTIKTVYRKNKSEQRVSTVKPGWSGPFRRAKAYAESAHQDGRQETQNRPIKTVDRRRRIGPSRRSTGDATEPTRARSSWAVEDAEEEAGAVYVFPMPKESQYLHRSGSAPARLRRTGCKKNAPQMRGARAADAPRVRSACTANRITCTAGEKGRSGAGACRHGACRADAPGRRLGTLRWEREGARGRPDSAGHAEGVVVPAAWMLVAATVHADRNAGWELRERRHSTLQAPRRRRASALNAGGFASPARGGYREGAVNAGRRRRESGRMRGAGGPLVRRLTVHALRLARTALRQRSNARRPRTAGARLGP